LRWCRDSLWSAVTVSASFATAAAAVVAGKKFDLRIYALVTAYSPLTVWLYRTGFGRFSNTRYTMDRSKLDNLCACVRCERTCIVASLLCIGWHAYADMHLTNVAIQKTAEGYKKEKGCKLALSKIKLLIASKHGMPAADKLMLDMQVWRRDSSVAALQRSCRPLRSRLLSLIFFCFAPVR
jgi:hypothetical protein